ncbi:hypothetical protein [Psychroflexus aestuariivivens]|uniref:hypothetical protein n=1 Tax=Psychroflexus aestuariivivens TaxID=1795040 RepID=UPI000FD75868|nr:hypothetical protein [Psychroflexus aestuariivivens]
MNKKKLIFDSGFILSAGAILIILDELELLEKFTGFELIPLLIVYYFGQFIERKTSTKLEKQSD